MRKLYSKPSALWQTVFCCVHNMKFVNKNIICKNSYINILTKVEIGCIISMRKAQEVQNEKDII